MTMPLLKRLARSTRGATLVEFAIVTPLLLLLLLGGLETCHTMYVRSALVGSLQKAARDLSLEGASSSVRVNAITASVTDAVHQIMPAANVSLVAKSYHDYSNAANPAEEYNDADHDGRCDHGEAFVDSNRNGNWDADGSVTGRGGARDVVLLVATASYNRLGLTALLPSAPQTVLTAKTLIRNQPNDQQADPPTGYCS
ncbi:TadE/TadG family type IV pilus assembly protein [Sphingomonas sp. RIT328]|uniref:TadE/TadG family type IV pilus assembly protein n=1 Tax=Sphingomonas sp. RIT328 TaxID=1470591 RepID=UPI000445C747|nr:TadE/TadG family type IV pilus assembly protein [Sphingomonas sp. RIT328]EZP50843.1 TadE-like protein [Sphingomonas sp. RIT328]